ncbi:hypothetical protein GCM10010363_48230 [Streptomyces omiyaensis]|nr:hypothetical protein GCM10010363_48230 [Streptomyces omiyaensis]
MVLRMIARRSIATQASSPRESTTAAVTRTRTATFPADDPPPGLGAGAAGICPYMRIPPWDG